MHACSSAVREGGLERNGVVSEPFRQVVEMDRDHGSHPQTRSHRAQPAHTIFVSAHTGQELGEDRHARQVWLRPDHEIDLSQQKADEFANMMRKYTDAARRVGSLRPSGPPGRASTGQ